MRPDILTVKPTPHPELPASWNDLKRGHAEAVAQILAMYPDREIHFLARDSELLYDFARVINKDNPAALSRIRLLNISRANMKAASVKDYLAQEGLSATALKSGKKILFVDTGFAGTIPQTIQSYIPVEYHSQLKTHLLCSANQKYPSTRVFLTAINPVTPKLNPGSMHSTIIDYEFLPRYTDRSHDFAKLNGRWEAVSSTNAERPDLSKETLKKLNSGDADGLYSKEIALRYMEDIAAYANEPKIRDLVQGRMTLYKQMNKMLAQPGRGPFIKFAQALLADQPSDPFIESLVRDFLEVHAKTLTTDIPLTIGVQDLGLKNITAPVGSNKLLIMEKYPQWKPLLEDPETGIKHLLETQDFATLGALSDAVYDDEFNHILAKALGEQKPTPKIMNFIKSMIDSGDPKVQESLRWTFSGPHLKELKPSLLYFIKTAGTDALRSLLFSRAGKNPELANMPDIFRAVLHEKNEATTVPLIENWLSQPHAVHLKDVIGEIVKNGTSKDLTAVSLFVLKQDFAADWDDFKQTILKRGDDYTLRALIGGVINREKDLQKRRIWIEEALGKGGPLTHRDLVHAFSKEHSAPLKDLLFELIDKADSETAQAIARYAFGQNYAISDRTLLRHAIERADRPTLEAFKVYSFPSHDNRWTQQTDSEFKVLKEALDIYDNEERKTFITKKLGPAKSHGSRSDLCRQALEQII